MHRLTPLAVVAVLVLALSDAAAARRIPTKAEGAAIAAAVKAYRDDDLGVLAKRWLLLNRCGTRVSAISTVNPRWALFRFRPRFKEGTAKQQSCLSAGGSPEATFILHRTGTRWRVTGWIYGERSGFCHAIAATKIPLEVFNDLYGKGFWSRDCR